VLKGKLENLSGILEIGSYEVNWFVACTQCCANVLIFCFLSKTINQTYEEYVLNVCDLDERIFLGEDANIEIGTPAKSTGDFAHHLQMRAGQMRQHVDEVCR
jgi:retinoblastoma-like protein 1